MGVNSPQTGYLLNRKFPPLKITLKGFFIGLLAVILISLLIFRRNPSGRVGMITIYTVFSFISSFRYSQFHPSEKSSKLFFKITGWTIILFGAGFFLFFFGLLVINISNVDLLLAGIFLLVVFFFCAFVVFFGQRILRMAGSNRNTY